MEIAIGTAVLCTDGRAGSVRKVLLQPGTGQVTHVVVSTAPVMGQNVVVPVDQVAAGDAEQVRLRLSKQELREMPPFSSADYAAPDAMWSAAVFARENVLFTPWCDPATGTVAARGGYVRRVLVTGAAVEEPVAVARGTRVECRDGLLGWLAHVMLEPRSKQVTALVVRKGRLLGKDVIVPVGWARDLSQECIYLDVSAEQLGHLAEYRPRRSDEQISAGVRDALASAGQAGRGTAIMVRTHQGVVELSGAVDTQAAKAAAGEAARGVEGVWEVRNKLLSGTVLCAEVTTALARDPRTSELAIDVSCLAGELTLSGTVRTQQQKQAAEEIARGIPRVGVVLNELAVRPSAQVDLLPEAPIPSGALTARR